MESKKITKNDLIDAVYLNTDYEKKTVKAIFNALLERMKDSLKDGSAIELRGFGTFEPRLRQGRSCARNPKTGVCSSVEPHHVAVFRPGQELKKALWDLPVSIKK
ncbi:MAG: HU family DNA-binding protein [Spirochaetales bacterium]